MKVIKVIGSLDFGGIEKVFEIVARYYEGDKGEIIFLALGKGGAAERAIRDLGFRVVVWNASTSVPAPRLVARLISFFRKERPHVVHTTGAEANFHGIIAAFLCRVPIRIAEEIGMPTHSWKGRIIFREVYRLASRVIAVANLVADFLFESGEAARSKVSVIYNPVDVRAFGAVERREIPDIFRIVVVCRLDPIKNLELLIRGLGALTELCNGRSEVWFIGDGPSREGLERLVRDLGLEDKIVFWGFQERPAAYLESASLFVLPSFSEGLPVSAVEAMLTRTPCAVTKIGGGPEFIDHGVNGWLLDPYDQESFNNLLLDIAGLPKEERLKIGERGKMTVAEKFQPSRYLDLVWELYRPLGLR